MIPKWMPVSHLRETRWRVENWRFRFGRAAGFRFSHRSHQQGG
jgi:hypothetical protein